MIEIFFGLNALAALFGWLAFNFVVMSSFKDDDEQKFSIKTYAAEHWDNWLGSLLFIPAFLFAGAKGFNFEDIGASGIKWSDAYYVGCGFFFELVKVAWKKWKSKNA